MINWEKAKKEVDIIVQSLEIDEPRAKNDGVEIYDIRKQCYKNAYKALKLLCNNKRDDCDGYLYLTKYILDELIEGTPLSPIREDDEWITIANNSECSVYSSKRLPSLFKFVYSDGHVEYDDKNRYMVLEQFTNAQGYYDDIIDRVRNIYIPPIKFPYMPTKEKWVICYDQIGTPEDSMTALYHVISPTGEKIIINKFYKDKDGKREEISKNNFYIMFDMYLDSLDEGKHYQSSSNRPLDSEEVTGNGY